MGTAVDPAEKSAVDEPITEEPNEVFNCTKALLPAGLADGKSPIA